MPWRSHRLLDGTNTKGRVGVAVGVAGGGGAASLDSPAKPGHTPIESITLVGRPDRRLLYNSSVRG